MKQATIGRVGRREPAAAGGGTLVSGTSAGAADRYCVTRDPAGAMLAPYRNV